MMNIEKEKTSKQYIKDNNNLEVTSKVAEEEYIKFYKRRKKIYTWGCIILLLIEIIFVAILGYNIKENNLYYRVLKEHEMISSGQIKLVKGIYTGETDFGYFFGKGKFSFSTGAEYIGELKENQLEGKGVLHIPNEGNYEGEFSSSRKNGKGTFTWDDGVIYEGEWEDDQMSGQGRYITPDGVIFTGVFQDNNLQDGTCTFKNSTGSYNLEYKAGNVDKAKIEYIDGSYYEGAFNDKELTGIGKMNFVSGDTYEGDFLDGYREGKGVYTWKLGDKYDGEWIYDQMTGSGLYTYSDGSYISGTFDKNIFIDGSYYANNSFGEYKFNIVNKEPTFVEMSLSDGTTYSGSMSGGKLSGQAQIKYSNGDQYSGDISDGKKSGQGTYIWTSGASYEGSWNDEQMNGLGTYFYSSGESGYKLVGIFDKGKPNGECEYYIDKTTHYKTNWMSGKCVKIYE